ncbi:MAG: hypothetical protein E6Q98_05230 [Rhodospirillaceae bacterium]|nr:MAG: hypothetical protein E6Q98_05230 [Rhodospirillaceae bacterium]
MISRSYLWGAPNHEGARFHRRGVDVKVILDKSQATAVYTGATYLQNAGVPVAIDYQVAIAHNKMMVIDSGTVITGSFNFTKAAQDKNAENLLVIRDVDLARQYLANWQARAAVSKPYKIERNLIRPRSLIEPRPQTRLSAFTTSPRLFPSRPVLHCAGLFFKAACRGGGRSHRSGCPP